MTTNAYTTSHTDTDAAATPMTPLRRRMIEDMVLRRLAPTTQKHYVRAVAMFAKHFNASPDTLDFEDVRRFRLHFVETKHNVACVNQVLTALRFSTCARDRCAMAIAYGAGPARIGIGQAQGERHRFHGDDVTDRRPPATSALAANGSARWRS